MAFDYLKVPLGLCVTGLSSFAVRLFADNLIVEMT